MSYLCMASPTIERPWSLTVYQGLAGDHNDRAIPGAFHLGQTFARALGRPLDRVGTPAPALNKRWDAELQAARPELRALQRHLRQVYASGRRPFTFLTRCAAALASLPVLAEVHPAATLIWFDAHADLNSPNTSNSGFLGGMVLTAAASLWDSGLGGGLDPSRVIYVGVRDIDPPEQAQIDQSGMHVVPVSSLMIKKVDAALGNAPVYVHLDCDVVEPGLVPTDYAVAGGLSFEQLTGLMQLLADRAVVGVEVSEFQEGEQAAEAAEALRQAMQPLLNAPSR